MIVIFFITSVVCLDLAANQCTILSRLQEIIRTFPILLIIMRKEIIFCLHPTIRPSIHPPTFSFTECKIF